MAPETTGTVKRAGLEAKALVEEVQQVIQQKAQKVCAEAVCWLQGDGLSSGLAAGPRGGVQPAGHQRRGCASGCLLFAGWLWAQPGCATKAKMVNRCKEGSLYSMALVLTCLHLFSISQSAASGSGFMEWSTGDAPLPLPPVSGLRAGTGSNPHPTSQSACVADVQASVDP